MFELNWKEPEVVVKYSLIRYYNYVINICVIEPGIEALACACEFRLRLRDDVVLLPPSWSRMQQIWLVIGFRVRDRVRIMGSGVVWCDC